MPIKRIILHLLLVLIPPIIYAEPVDKEKAIKIAHAKIKLSGKENNCSIENIFLVSESNTSYFYAATLHPVGYMIVSADDNLPPVIAYSFQNDIDTEGKLFDILKADIKKRLESIDKIPINHIKIRKLQWEALFQKTNKSDIITQYWPPTGTTSTGGWLETNWTQNAPYNQMCPMDAVTSTRSYVGCPATAMGQILNFHQTTNNTVFNNNDNYYHNYASRTFYIDDDFALHGFPSFPQLNEYLDTLNIHYQNNIIPTNQDKAALSFACGVAAKQVYTSAGSGTFGVSQALDAYQRFDCNTAVLLDGTDTSLFTRLIQNMKDSLPAHLAIVDAAWSTGHNIVVDGYNTDNYFHCNFGWGGSSNGWYLLPDEMPYSMTVVEGLIVDILQNAIVSTPQPENELQVSIYPNPAHSYITINTGTTSNCSISVLNVLGQLVFNTKTEQQQIQIDTDNLGNRGIYFIRITNNENKILKTQKIILQ